MFRNLVPGAVGIKANFDQALDLAKRFGFGGTDVPVAEIANIIEKQGVQAARDKFANAGLKVGGFGCPVEFRQDEAKWKQGLEALPRLAKAAQAVGCTRCATWIMPAHDQRPFQEHFDLHVTRLRPVAQTLNDHGIGFGLEFVGPKTSRVGKKYEFIWNMAGMLELNKAIGTPNMGLLLDIWHWYTSYGTVADIKKLTARQVVYVHVNDAPKGKAVDEQIDNQRCLPCETGVIDSKSFMQALKAIGYDGPLTPEPFRKDLATLPADEAARLVADAMNKLWQVGGLA
ncbi:MAG: sugar phosphate isomerase/epimerase [Planctomycetes bacterium]|nr:sugar phosphate isomerase/epimerase [Planctomycetota bacterium]